MRLVIQRVSEAKVEVDNKVVGKIGRGFLVLLGVGQEDNEEKANFLVEKLCNLRVFRDENEKMNLSIKDIDGEILSVSQFTLCAKLDGRRPSFSNAAVPNVAKEMFDKFNATLENLGVNLKKGCFQEHMEVELINDGPFTIICDSKNK